jgi:hypothetical protein
VSVRSVGPEARPNYQTVSLARGRLRVSQDTAGLSALQDGRLDTLWEVTRRPGLADWVEVMLPAPVPLARIELMLGERRDAAGRDIAIAVSEDGQRWRHIRSFPGRAVLKSQNGSPSQVFLFPTLRARGVRIIEETRHGRWRWGIAELRLGTLGAGAAE